MQWVPAIGPARPRIQLLADPGSTYAIERSTNLTDWLPVVSGSITNGTLDLLDVDVLAITTAFYRGRVATATDATPPVQATLDLQRTALSLVTPEAGGSCALTNQDGDVQFRLRQ